MANTAKEPGLREFVKKMSERAGAAAKSVECTKLKLASERHELKIAVETYNAALARLVEEEISTKGYTWCTKCLSLVYNKIPSPENVELVLIEGSEEYTHGEGGAYYGFRDFATLHRACSRCRREFFEQHGRVGPYDRYARGQARFHAFHVEKHEDGYYYANRFGQWEKVDTKHQLPETPPNKVIAAAVVATMFNLPPKLEIKEDKIVA